MLGRRFRLHFDRFRLLGELDVLLWGLQCLGLERSGPAGRPSRSPMGRTGQQLGRRVNRRFPASPHQRVAACRAGGASPGSDGCPGASFFGTCASRFGSAGLAGWPAAAGGAGASTFGASSFGASWAPFGASTLAIALGTSTRGASALGASTTAALPFSAEAPGSAVPALWAAVRALRSAVPAPGSPEPAFAVVVSRPSGATVFGARGASAGRFLGNHRDDGIVVARSFSKSRRDSPGQRTHRDDNSRRQHSDNTSPRAGNKGGTHLGIDSSA